ncbi:MAG: winged helix-turn-helix domain-containing protein [Candidatus Hydrothermarchaeales archaeon]
MKLELSALQIMILKELCADEYRNISGLAGALDKSLTRVSIAIKDLEKKGFVETQKIGISKQLDISSNKHAVSFKIMAAQYPHLHLEKLLSGSALQILLPLTYRQKLRLEEIEKLSGCSERTLRRVVKGLKEFGIMVVDENFSYSIGSFYFRLSEFIRDFQGYLNLRLALSFSNTAVILWQQGKEFLIKALAEKKVECFFPTGYEKLSDYGIQLILTGSRYYFYSPFKKKLGVEDAALHTLSLEPESPRNVLYVLMIVAKNIGKIDRDYLRSEAAKFGLEGAVEDIARYLKTKGMHRPEYFPLWEEFKAKAEEYEICL